MLQNMLLRFNIYLNRKNSQNINNLEQFIVRFYQKSLDEVGVMLYYNIKTYI